MASQTQGIQQLLVAEKRAAEKVAEARKRKTRRIKQAREEAAAEVELYRNERERQFREYEAKYMGSASDVAAKIDKNTQKNMEEMDLNEVWIVVVVQKSQPANHTATVYIGTITAVDDGIQIWNASWLNLGKIET
ncbi:unnamed protein product [Phaedon cochleariae]|uniref:V-type proton ATPase subunit G n=1 Tax=Phaedon cochleariae TaxID=80249 RepID=A0A9N9SBC2_PHACE|nr:unnamed protein product [Phaedon cochleariae]